MRKAAVVAAMGVAALAAPVAPAVADQRGAERFAERFIRLNLPDYVNRERFDVRRVRVDCDERDRRGESSRRDRWVCDFSAWLERERRFRDRQLRCTGVVLVTERRDGYIGRFRHVDCDRR